MGSEIYGTLSVRQHDMSLLWDFQPEVGQQNSSYAFFFLAVSFMVDFAFKLSGSFGSIQVFLLRVKGGILCIHFFF